MGLETATAEELAVQIADWNRQYYAGTPVVDDETWQAARDQLKVLQPENPLLHTVGAPLDPTSALKKAKHGIPMGSLANAFEESDIRQFMKRVRSLSSEAGTTPPIAFVLQPKLDGFSLDLRYKKGHLVQAITRGDGIEGEDVTHNAFVAKSIPKSLSAPISLWVRGEAVIHREDMAKHFPEASNPRNTAAGVARRIDSVGAEHLKFYAFDAVTKSGEPLDTTEGKSLKALTALGFTVAPTWLIKNEDADALDNALLARWTTFKDERLQLPYDCDGLVVKVSNISKSRALGETDNCPRSMSALKWRGTMVAEGFLGGVENSVGRSGAITPVGILSPPVACGGVLISRVSLANWSIVENLDIRVGSKVRIERAGEVIPRVVSVLWSPELAPAIQRPNNCPKCQQETVEDGPRQMCVNVDCPARTFRAVLHYTKQRNIMFLGEECVDKLMALDGPVQSIPDLYDLTDDQLASAAGGYVMAKKVLESINKSRECPLHELLGSVGIPALGHSEAKKLVTALKLKTVDDFISACAHGLSVGIPGFGAEKAAKVQRGCALREDMLRRLAAVMTVTVGVAKSGPLSGKNLCATGPSEHSRDQIITLIKDNGGEWKSTVTNDTHYLIMADPTSTSTKAEAARKKGVTCISEKQFLDMIGYDKAAE